MAQSNEECPLDYEEGLVRAGGERDFYFELLSLLIEDLHRQIQNLRDLTAANDFVGIVRTAHAIKRATANLAVLPLRDAAQALKSYADSPTPEPTKITELVDTIRTEFDRLVAHVKTF